MAEPVGTTLGALGILGLLSVSLDCFNFIQDGMSLGKDFAHIDGQLSTLRIRLYAWAKACGFLRGQGYDKRLDSPEWQAHIRTQLSSISLLFLDAGKIVNKYHVGQTYEWRTTNQHFVDQGLRDYLARVAMTKTKAGLAGQFQWALVYRRRMTELVQRLRECIEALELVSRYPDLFETRDLMVRQEVGMLDDVRSLRNMITAESGAGVVSDAASERLSQLERSIPSTNRASSSNCASPPDSESSSDGESSSNGFPATREDVNVVGVTLAPFSETVNEVTRARTRSGATRKVVTVPTLPEAVRKAHVKLAKKRRSPRQTWNQLDPVSKQVLQQTVADTVLGNWDWPAKDNWPAENMPQGPFSSLKYLLSSRSGTFDRHGIMSRFEQDLPGEDPDVLFQGTLAEMDIPTEDELWASMQPLFHTLVQAQQWPQDGVDMLRCQVAELQAPFKIRQHCCLLLQELAKGDLRQSPWGQFVQHDEYVSFRPRDKETGHVLAMGWLQAFATSTMQLELMSPTQPSDGSSALSDAQRLYLKDLDTAEVERLVTCFVDVYASVMMTVKLKTWATDLKKLLLPEWACEEKRAPEQQVRVMAELSLGRSPDAFVPRLDGSDWGTRLAPMLRSDLTWLSENPQWLTSFRGHFGKQMCLVRLAGELRRWRDGRPAFVSLRPLRLAVKGSCSFRISFEGPPQSPYQSGIFHLLCDYPLDYPAAPPKIRFLTRVYHPNISPDGQVCIDILSGNWSPALISEAVVISILSLLSDPETVDPLVPEIAATFLQDRPLYERNARLYTMKHAGVDQEYADYQVVPFHMLHENANAAESMA
ncbi:uncharacterized protein J7T54_006352 [Emericellopsis cladophorae]|uniref:UBC core domain-containing protein n=1 Tax=Emericellopsis cladophorae TaxID=2686198 RepID=A0A9P9Y9G2_9HYPO|nr:uncharacterized protein J7T54_006352 [Emericellopsis cladophorae]KAI6786013.1 hypothetical protein J7T54_006352 [Emericellopsis cladophorae]